MVTINASLTRKTVLVVQQNAKDAELLAYAIESSGRFNVIAICHTHDTCLKIVVRSKPDILITDVPDSTDGIIRFINAVRRIDTDMRVLFVSDTANETLILESIKVGVEGFVLRSESINKIIEGLESILSGDYLLGPAVVNKLFTVLRINRDSPLSGRESEILKLLTRGMTNTEIALYLNISRETSKTHVKNIYRKLKVGSRSEAIATAFRERWV